jgi:probable F420-dependent oxidoreductase
MGRWAMTVPLESRSLLEQRRWVEELADLGYEELWSSEAQDLDGFSPLLLASQWAPSLALGCAVFPVQTRGAALMAMSVAAMCQAAPGRFTMGIGCSSEYVVEHWNGIPFRRPYQYTRDMALFLREALTGARITRDYECFGVKGFRLRREVPEPPPILLGALRPGMLELAGRVGDGAILNWVLPEDLPRIIPHVRKHGEDKRIVVRTVVCPSADAGKVRAVARGWIAGYFNVPTYRAQQEWLGRGPALEAMWKLWAEGDRAGAVKAVPDALVDGFYAHGAPEQVREHVERFFANGADTVIVAFLEGAVDAVEASRRIAPR